jgi:RNA polymerase sigma-70 factor (ECF subfamily)
MEPPESRNVRDVLQAAVNGDTAGLGELLASYQPRLERMVGFRLDGRLRGRVDPGDVLQETFAEVVDRLPGYLDQPDAEFFLWVRYLASQKLLQHHRRHLEAGARDARKEVPLNLQGMPGASSFALASAILQSDTPSRAAMNNEEGARLQDALEGMKEIDREILMLRHFEHLSNREAAQLLELTEPGASLRYMRALKRLREILDTLELSSDGFGGAGE